MSRSAGSWHFGQVSLQPLLMCLRLSRFPLPGGADFLCCDLQPTCAALPHLLHATGDLRLHLRRRAASPGHRCGRKGRSWAYKSGCGNYELHRLSRFPLPGGALQPLLMCLRLSASRCLEEQISSASTSSPPAPPSPTSSMPPATSASTSAVAPPPPATIAAARDGAGPTGAAAGTTSSIVSPASRCLEEQISSASTSTPPAPPSPTSSTPPAASASTSAAAPSPPATVAAARAGAVRSLSPSTTCALRSRLRCARSLLLMS